MRDPWEVATWRFEQISPLLDSALSEADKRRYIRERSAQSVEWPHTGRGQPPRRPISRDTLLRWLRAYEAEGIKGLLPKVPERQKTDRSRLVAYALALLVEEPDRSLEQLLRYLEIEFPDDSISRSTLHRELTRHPAYLGIVKRRSTKQRKLRDRIETARPHECWQLDGKGPFQVKLVGSSRARVHVLSIIDDYSRFILAAIVAPSESIAATVRVFRLAAASYGLPDRIQFDRGSAFDSTAFRCGLAQLGSHRNWIEKCDPGANGKVEAYHRSLKRWFVKELRHQEVINLEHLQDLLDATLALVYGRHWHREIKMTPEEALDGRICDRRVSRDDFRRAFWASETAKSHPKTGEVSLPNGRFRVPVRYAGRKCTFHYDPVDLLAVLVRGRDEEIELEPFAKKPLSSVPTNPPRGTGQLQKLLDRWRGRERPNAQPRFGLPEVFVALGSLLGHSAPRDEREARAIHRFYREFGPLHPQHFRSAIDTTRRDLGEKRSLSTYLEHLARLIRAARSHPKEDPS
jgi:transposase InsO family protein